MRFLITLILGMACFPIFAQSAPEAKTKKDSLIIIAQNPAKGFRHDYILFIPAKTPLNKRVFLLVEPNNTGKVSDDIEVHKKAAVGLAAASSVGNNVSSELRIPLLVPIFPRPESDSLKYVHALDRDVMLDSSAELNRLDLQLLAMVSDARLRLAEANIFIEQKFFMNGFSASATFTNRFSMAHPEKIQALAIGGFNGELMLPQSEIDGIKLEYPIGTQDFAKIFGKNFDIEAFRKIPQLVYMGRLDDNDAVQYDDAYGEEERGIINSRLGNQTQTRFAKCQQIYLDNGITADFRSFENVGHWTTPEMNLEVITFFYARSKSKSAVTQTP